ncbi:putative membrane protein (plasmid) [Sinorhizobium sp. RAC02]|nr:putative membrane protein [Sinorhizobium sp. RAC02]
MTGNIIAGLLWDSYGSFVTFATGAVLSLIALPIVTLVSRWRVLKP